MARRQLVLALSLIPALALRAPAQEAQRILALSGVAGGLVVHLGCGDGRLTAALGAEGPYVVQGLDTDPGHVAAARSYVESTGRYGSVSVRLLAGNTLPYTDNLVNLLVVSGEPSVSREEILRVLAPRGVWMAAGPPPRVVVRKPWLPDLDEWTHRFHGPDGNPVSHDRVVGPPHFLRWSAAPRWARGHGWTPSVSSMVSARGRLFYICDEGLTGAAYETPGQWMLVARDGFSGVLLWKRRVPEWGSKAFSGTPDNGDAVTVGRFTMPLTVGKHLVAVGDTVYVTLGATAPVSALDAATGKVKRVYEPTRNADEMVVSDGRIIVSVNPPPAARPAPVPKDQTPPPPPGKYVAAVDPRTGKLLWKKGPFVGLRATRAQDPFGRLELGAGGGRVYLVTQTALHALAADTGKTLWTTPRPALPARAVRRLGYAGMYEYLLTVLVYHRGVLLLAQPEPNIHHTYHTMPGTLYAFAAATGKLKWRHGYGGWGHCTRPDVFAVGNTVWTHVHVPTEWAPVWGHGYRAKDPSKVAYRIQALDLETGKVRREISTREIFNVGHHHRCYRNSMTDRFLMSCRRGVEFVDLNSGENYQNHWVRSGCHLGYVPGNGLLYVAPHPCACYVTAKLTGFNALASTQTSSDERVSRPQRVPGPQYGKVRLRPAESDPGTDWPTYRREARRTGSAEWSLSERLKPGWQTEVGKPLTGLTVAAGVVFVAEPDAHTVHALDASTGRERWRFGADGRIDSPPTFYRGLVLFGSAGGSVFCLRATGGTLVWRFRAAPAERQVMIRNQLESAWPVPGSVLVRDGVCWFAAGRSSYLDGGIHVWALDPVTGSVVYHHVVFSLDPKTGKMSPSPSPNKIPGLLNDIPGSDGANVFVRQLKVSPEERAVSPHLFSTAGFLDASWFNRTYWTYGRARTTGVMVLGDGVAYGMEAYPTRGADALFRPGTKPYRLQCWSTTARAPRGKRGRRRLSSPLWQKRLDVRVTALVRLKDHLFAAGSPDVVDPKDPTGAWEGRKGGVLVVLAAENGRELARYELPAPPVWDGLAAANGRLYLSLVNGAVMSWQPT